MPILSMIHFILTTVASKCWVKSLGPNNQQPPRSPVHSLRACRSSKSGLHCSCGGYCAVKSKLQCKSDDHAPNCCCDMFRFVLSECTELRKSLGKILLSSTQAGPGRKVKQEQEEICRNHVPRLFLGSVHNRQTLTSQ